MNMVEQKYPIKYSRSYLFTDKTGKYLT